jgi:hypothetical protein
MDNITMARETLADLRDKLALAQDELRRAKAPITDFTDVRLTPFLTKANEVATTNGYCDTYEEILEEIGAPLVKNKWRISVELNVAARTRDQAETALDQVLAVMDTEVVTHWVPTSARDFTQIEE